MATKKRPAPSTEDIVDSINERSQEMRAVTEEDMATFQEPVADTDPGMVTVREAGVASPTAPVRRPGQVRGTPGVLSGRVIGEELDPNAERALKDPKVAAKYQSIKERIREYLELEGRRTELMRSIAEQLLELRQQFKQPGSKGKRLDWNGESDAYRALAHLVYLDAGATGPEGASLQRAIRYHVDQRKRELVPRRQWDHYNIQALSQGERAALAKRFASEHEALTSGAEQVGTKAKKGEVTGSQLVSLAKTIEKGVSVYQPEALHTLTPKQRDAFRERMAHVREQADSLLEELDAID